MGRRWVVGLAGLLAGICALSSSAARARTRLLEVDLRTGRKRAIDRRGPRNAADRELDSMLGKAMGKTFSTADLARIEKALRRYIRAARPRARARVLLFLYPGAITKTSLRSLREVLVDIDLLIDPCGRSFCRDAVGKHLELIGKSLRQAVVRTRDYKIRFKAVTIRTTTQVGGTQFKVYRFGATQAVRVGRRGGGARLAARVDRARSGWSRTMTRAIARALRSRRVRLRSAPRVSRGGGRASVTIAIRSDRVRIKRDLLRAIGGAGRALASSRHTPASGQLTIQALVQRARRRRETYRCTLAAAKGYAAGRISGSSLWSTYVAHKRRGARSMSFSDSDTRPGGSSSSGGGSFDPAAVRQVLLSNMQSSLAPCLTSAARRSRRFRGVTLIFYVRRNGRATRVSTKERAPGVRRCLRSALRHLRFSRHRGAPRRVTFPMYISR